ncbi:MAG: hypothetical protein HEP71_21920 [Roseivirga sp.]|nr:hypothetical protein [Roseivirga sp.]
MIQKGPLQPKYFWVFLIVVVCCFNSCSQKENTESSEISDYKIEIADSVVLNRLSPVTIRDYNEKTDELLLESLQTGEVLVMSGKGEIISSFKPYTEGPNYTEDRSFGWSFSGDNELLAYGQVYFHRLTKSGDLKDRIPYPVDVRGWVIRDYDPENIFQIQEGRNAEILAIIPGASTPYKTRTQTYMDSARKVFAINIQSGEHRSLSPIPAVSDYRTMGAYVDSGTPIMTRMKGNTFASTYEVDSKIYLHDMAKNQLVKVLDIPEDYLPEYESVPFGSKGKATISRGNARIFSTGDKIIVVNIGQIPDDVMRGIMELEGWWESPELEAAARQHMTHTYLVFDEEGFLGELKWEDNAHFFYQTAGTENGYFWIQRQYSDERDYLTFLKVRVVKAD